MTRIIIYFLLCMGCCVSCVWKPNYDRVSDVSDSLRYELAREKKQRVELQEYAEKLYYRYVDKKGPRGNNFQYPEFESIKEFPLPPPKEIPAVTPASTPMVTEPVKEEKDLNELIAFPNMRVRNSGNSKIISFPEGAFFDAGSARLNKQAQKYLSDFAKTFADREDYMIDIEGHTDDTEQSKEEGVSDRWDLSTRRASNVLRELIRLGVSPYRVIASGRGQFKPRVPNEPVSNKKRNRRIEIRVSPLRP